VNRELLKAYYEKRQLPSSDLTFAIAAIEARELHCANGMPLRANVARVPIISAGRRFFTRIRMTQTTAVIAKDRAMRAAARMNLFLVAMVMLG